MPELRKTEYVGEVVWLGQTTRANDLLLAEVVDRVDLTLDGILGEIHSGATRPACVRVRDLYAEGTEIANTRQLTVLSQEDLLAIAADMRLDRVDPARLGGNVVLRGIPDFTHLPPSSRLQAESGATLVVDRLNLPCTIPARSIEAAHPGFGKAFKPAAAGRRGVTAWVERGGELRIGSRLRLFVPDQRAWHAEETT